MSWLSRVAQRKARSLSQTQLWINAQQQRGIKITSAYQHNYFKYFEDKKNDNEFVNFTRFTVPNQHGQHEYDKLPRELKDHEFNYPLFVDTLGMRWPGYWIGRRFYFVPEMVPELVVPDLTGFKLKPYVSYRVEDVNTDEFTAKDLFNATYANDVIKRYKRGERVEIKASDEEIQAAAAEARRPMADIFDDSSPWNVYEDEPPEHMLEQSP